MIDAITPIAARVPSLLSARQILAAKIAPDADTPAPMTFRIHPEDMRELRSCYRYCWPDNAAENVFLGVKLIVDDTAARMDRVPL